MKFTCTQENLNHGLNLVSHIASKNTSLPILNNVLIRAEKGSLNLITTNLEMGINCQIRGKIENEGSFTVNSKLFYDYINLLSSQNIDLELKDENIKIKTEKQNTKIKGSNAEEFPLLPQIEKKDPIICSISQMVKAISQVIFSVSVSETRPEISGVYFKFKDDSLTLAATDSYRLAEKTIKLKEKTTQEKEVIVPAKTIGELYRILSNINGPEDVVDDEKGPQLEIYFEDNQVLFSFDNVELVSRIIEGQYPNYKQIIPIDYKTKAIVNIADFIKATKTAALFSRTGIYDINVEIKGGKLEVSSTNNQLGESKASVESKAEGDDNSIIVNYRYLLDGLQSMDSTSVIFEMTDMANPCLLKPAESLPEKEAPVISQDYLYIVMPIKQ